MTSQNAFKIGDTVKLKSGGPDMTVHSVPNEGSFYYCQWFAGKKLELGKFQFGALEAVPSKP